MEKLKLYLDNKKNDFIIKKKNINTNRISTTEREPNNKNMNQLYLKLKENHSKRNLKNILGNISLENINKIQRKLYKPVLFNLMFLKENNNNSSEIPSPSLKIKDKTVPARYISTKNSISTFYRKLINKYENNRSLIKDNNLSQNFSKNNSFLKRIIKKHSVHGYNREVTENDNTTENTNDEEELDVFDENPNKLTQNLRVSIFKMVNKNEFRRNTQIVLQSLAESPYYTKKNNINSLFHNKTKKDIFKYNLNQLKKTEIKEDNFLFNVDPKINALANNNKYKRDYNKIRISLKNLLFYLKKLNINPSEMYLTPLHWAIKREDIKIANLLIKFGADVNAQDLLGRTPLYFAIKNKNLKITKLLLFSKAEPWSTLTRNYNDIFDENTLEGIELEICLKMTPPHLRDLVWEKDGWNLYHL